MKSSQRWAPVAWVRFTARATSGLERKSQSKVLAAGLNARKRILCLEEFST